MNQDQSTAQETGAPQYTPSDAAKQALTRALETMAMADYREMPKAKQADYQRGFVMGYDGLPFPREAIENRAMDAGFMFGARAIHKGYKQRETDLVLYA